MNEWVTYESVKIFESGPVLLETIPNTPFNEKLILKDLGRNIEKIIVPYERPGKVVKYFRNGNRKHKFDLSLEQVFVKVNGYPSGIYVSKWTEESIKHFFKYFPEKLNLFTDLSSMRESEDNRIKQIYLWFERNGGITTFCKVLEECGKNLGLNYYTHTGQKLRSKTEFYCFAIFHQNNIIFDYENVRIENYLPDFFLSNFKKFVEILGMNGDKKYDKKTITKIEDYQNKKIDCWFVNVDTHNPFDSLFDYFRNKFKTEFGVSIDKPNIQDYIKKYVLSDKQVFEEFKQILIDLESGNITQEYIFRNKRSIFVMCLETYNGFLRAYIEVIGYPMNMNRSSNYYTEFLEYEIENIIDRLKYFPSYTDCQKNNKCVLHNRVMQIYQTHKTFAFKINGEFYHLVGNQGWNQFLPTQNIDEKIKNDIVKYYSENNVSIEQTSKQFFTSVSNVVNILKEFSISERKLKTIRKKRSRVSTSKLLSTLNVKTCEDLANKLENLFNGKWDRTDFYEDLKVNRENLQNVLKNPKLYGITNDLLLKNINLYYNHRIKEAKSFTELLILINNKEIIVEDIKNGMRAHKISKKYGIRKSVMDKVLINKHTFSSIILK
jgi:hypothetical protein